MNAQRHIREDFLLDYATGTLGEGWSLLVATHLALCPSCRSQVRAAEAVGGVLLEEVTPAAMAPCDLDSLFARLDEGEAAEGVGEPHGINHPLVPVDKATLPSPLRDYLGGDLGDLKWRRLGFGARHIPVKTRDESCTVRLLRIPAGAPVPTHGHNGPELTLVLTGSFSDGDQVFQRGDVEEADESIVHQPIAGDGEDCVCLAVTDAPLRFKNLAARLVQPFIGI